MTNHKDRIEILEEQRQGLMEQYAAAVKQQTKSLSDVDQKKLEIEIDDLDKKISDLEEKINRLKLGQSDKDNIQVYGEYSKTWGDKLPYLNFTESKKIIKDIFSRLESDEEEQALFLLQRKETMKGDLCVQHIEESLQSLGDYYPPFKYPFPRTQTPPTPAIFLNELAKRFVVDMPSSEIQHYTSLVIDKLCKSLTGGNVFLLYVEFSIIALGDKFLEWFVSDFWNQLIIQLDRHRISNPYIKVVGVIAIRNLLPKTCLSAELRCTKKKFDGRKVLDLPLKNWSQKEIYDWLWKHSKLSGLGYEQTHMRAMAETIYADSDKGKPSDACNQLLEALKQSLNEKRVS